jgi:hypothetical protein
VVGWPSNAWTGEGWPDFLVWLPPYLFGMEVKQPKAHATQRQLARLIWLRKHRVHAWIVRSPAEAVTIIRLALEGLSEMTFNDDLLADLDAALNGGPVEAPAAVAEPEALPEFNFEPLASPYTEEHQHAVEVVTGKILPPLTDNANLDEQVESLVEATEVMAAETMALEQYLARMTDAMEAVVLELAKLNANVSLLRGDVESVVAVEADPPQTVAAPTPRTRRRKAPEAEAAPNGTEEISL